MTNPLDRDVYQVVAIDAGDGSGDIFVPLPDELLSQLGWKEGDTVHIQALPDGVLKVSKVEQPILPANDDPSAS